MTSRGAARSTAWEWRSLVALWVAAFSFYGLTATGHSSSWDARLMFLSARSFFYQGDLSVPVFPGTGGLRKTGVDGRQYHKFGPGFVFAHLPMLAVSRVAKHLPLVYLSSGERAPGRSEDEFWAQLTNAWITASLLVLLAAFVTELGGTRRDAWLVVLLVGAASPLWIYARVDSTEALQGLGLLGACYFLRRGSLRAEPSIHHWIAGAALGIAILTKTFNVVLLPLFLGYLISTASKRRFGALTAFSIPLAIALGLTGLYNFRRFGSPFDSGYDLAVEGFTAPLVPGVLKLLFLPSYGLAIFWPGIVLVLLGARRQWRAHPADTALGLGIFLTLLLLYARWWAYPGFGWGPRFLIPTLPLLGLCALPVVASRGRIARALTLACLVGGFGIQTVATMTNHWQQVLFGVYRQVECGPDGSLCMENAQVAPLRVAWWRLEGTYLRAEHPERFSAWVESTPWRSSHPWLDPQAAIDVQRENTGIDYWSAPAPWRLERYYLWAPGFETAIPGSPRLAALLAVLLGGALVVVVRAERSRPGAP